MGNMFFFRCCCLEDVKNNKNIEESEVVPQNLSCAIIFCGFKKNIFFSVYTIGRSHELAKTPRAGSDFHPKKTKTIFGIMI